MLRRPLGLSQATLARPSHCGHTLWAHIEVITPNVEVEEAFNLLLFFSIFSRKVYTPLPHSFTVGIPLINNMRVNQIKTSPQNSIKII